MQVLWKAGVYSDNHINEISSDYKLNENAVYSYTFSLRLEAAINLILLCKSSKMFSKRFLDLEFDPLIVTWKWMPYGKAKITKPEKWTVKTRKLE